MKNNIIGIIHPELLKYFISQDEAFKYSCHSKHMVLLKCPICGHIKSMPIDQFTSHGFACPFCSDGVSYPNKFVRNLFKQLGESFECEAKFEWLPNRLYDLYFYQRNTIVEIHGSQHYQGKPNFHLISNRKDWEIDIEKRKYALDNGIVNYIEIDCSKSNLEYIKHSIMHSELPQLFNFSEIDIDWQQCVMAAESSLVKEVWDLWNAGLTNGEILSRVKISKTTLRDYVRRGYEIGICNNLYQPKNNRTKSHIKTNNDNGLYNARPTYVEDDNIYFATYKDVINYYESQGLIMSPSRISVAVNHKSSTRGKYFTPITKREFNNKYDLADISDYQVVGERFDDRFLEVM